MLLYANTSVFMWKSIVFWFCTVWCLHRRCEMRHFYTLRCPAPFWLIQCKPYRNRFIIVKVIDKSLGARFLWPTVYIRTLLKWWQNASSWQWEKQWITVYISRITFPHCGMDGKGQYNFCHCEYERVQNYGVWIAGCNSATGFSLFR